MAHSSIVFMMLLALFVGSTISQSPAPAPTGWPPAAAPTSTPAVSAPAPDANTPLASALSPTTVNSPAPPATVTNTPPSLTFPPPYNVRARAPAPAPAPSKNGAVLNRFAASGSLAVGIFTAVLVM